MTDVSGNKVSSDISSSFGIFILMTIIYSTLKIIFGVVGNNMWIAGYLLLTVIVQWQLNSIIAKDNCDNVPQTQTVVLATLLPWIGVFGLMHVLLMMFPGWKSPFSNTLGYLIASMSGIKRSFVALMETPEAIKQSSQGDKALLKSIEYLYTDSSLMINEITPENFEDAMARLEPMMSKEGKSNPALKKKFYSFILMKDTIAECIWLLLTGCMSINIAFSTILNASCSGNK